MSEAIGHIIGLSVLVITILVGSLWPLRDDLWSPRGTGGKDAKK